MRPWVRDGTKASVEWGRCLRGLFRRGPMVVECGAASARSAAVQSGVGIADAQLRREPRILRVENEVRRDEQRRALVRVSA